MDNVTPVTKWTDGAGNLYDSEAAAVQGEARRIVCNIVRDAIDRKTGHVDVERLLVVRTRFIDALRKIETRDG